MWPAEAQGLRDPLTGAPGLWQGAALLLPEKTACIQLPGPAAAVHDSWLTNGALS